MNSSSNVKILEQFCTQITDVFASEDCMSEYWKSKNPIEFDRTGSAKRLIWSIFEDIFFKVRGVKPVAYDGIFLAKQLAKSSELDYNIKSQCILNLQAAPQFTFDRDRLNFEIEASAIEASKLGATEAHLKTSKLDKSESPWSEKLNRYINLKAIAKIVDGYNPNISWRISPKHTTPAMTDNHNVSMLRQESVEYIKTFGPHLGIRQINWDQDYSAPLIFDEESGGIRTPGIDYDFFSKSGGDILGKSLFSRRLTCKLYELDEVINVMPRLNSLTVIYNMNSIGEKELDDYIFKSIGDIMKGVI